MTSVRFIDAIGRALGEAMEQDATVRILGEDVSVGGPFGATRGLVEEFGENRVSNTPISEGTVVGMAIGAAATGLRPVVEVMFMDFITLAMDQLVNHAAKLHYMSGGQLRVPLTIRAQGGVSGSYGAHHSQSLESWFVHVPGLKVVAPSTPHDAYHLLLAAIADDNPVLFLEHRALYWDKGEIDDHPVPLGSAAIRRPGSDVTIVAYSRTVAPAFSAAEALADEGVEAEVIDLRSLAPLDSETVVESVRKTRRLVIAHEAVTTAGVGAEVAAIAQAGAFDRLVAPIERVGAPHAPVPASPPLENEFVPHPDRIAAAIRRVFHQEDVENAS